MRLYKTMDWLAAIWLLAVPLHSAFGHEGHDHGSPPRPATLTAAPRAEAASELFELVAAARDGELTIYLDRFATGEPVTDAAISVETPQGGGIDAKPAPDGTYRLPAPWSGVPRQLSAHLHGGQRQRGRCPGGDAGDSVAACCGPSIRRHRVDAG